MKFGFLPGEEALRYCESRGREFVEEAMQQIRSNALKAAGQVEKKCTKRIESVIEGYVIVL